MSTRRKRPRTPRRKRAHICRVPRIRSRVAFDTSGVHSKLASFDFWPTLARDRRLARDLRTAGHSGRPRIEDTVGSVFVWTIA